MPAVPDLLTPLIASFERDLRARRRSPKTIRSYGDTARMFCRYHAGHGGPMDPAEVTRDHVQAFIIDQLDRYTPSTAATRFRCLQQFWKFVVDEGEAERSPMAAMSPPTLPEAPVPILSDDEVKALLRACEGKSFEDRRDMALVRLFITSGVRLGEMAGTSLSDLDLDEQVMLVTGKGERSRWVSFGDVATVSLDRYLRLRARHRRADLPALWVGDRGPLTASGIDQALRKRAKRAGVEGFKVHRFRHTFSHRWLAAGGTEGDLQELAGWKSPQMLARYGASARSERARQAYKRLDIEGDT